VRFAKVPAAETIKLILNFPDGCIIRLEETPPPRPIEPIEFARKRIGCAGNAA
jgi:hypothetical protein